MHTATYVCAGLAAAIHVLFFLMESVLFMQPKVYRRFGVASAAHAEAMRVLALNQGFYNLFLAIGAAVGLAMAEDQPMVGVTLVAFTCASMLGAAIILAASDSKLIAGAVMQGVPPAAALGFLLP